MSRYKSFNYEPFEEYLEILLARDIINGWNKLAPGHYRISEKLDVWPRNQKFGYRKSSHGEFTKFGSYKDLEKLITRLQYGLQK